MLPLATGKVNFMEQDYWLRRSSVAAMMAREATSAEARLIHYDLAGRYSVRAAFGRVRRTGRDAF